MEHLFAIASEYLDGLLKDEKTLMEQNRTCQAKRVGMRIKRTRDSIDKTLATIFIRRLQQEHTTTQWARMIVRTLNEPDKHICHSHNYCDANQVMIDALEEMTGQSYDSDNNEMHRMTENAWTMARTVYFDVDSIESL